MNLCILNPGGLLDWVVAVLLLVAAFFHFLINRDPEIQEPSFLAAARWVLCVGLATLGTKYLYILVLDTGDALTANFTALGMLAVAISQLLFGLYTFQKHHGASKNVTPVTPVSGKSNVK